MIEAKQNSFIVVNRDAYDVSDVIDLSSKQDHQINLSSTVTEQRTKPFFEFYSESLLDIDRERDLRNIDTTPARKVASFLIYLRNARVLSDGFFVCDANNQLLSASFRAYGMVQRFGFTDEGKRLYTSKHATKVSNIRDTVAVIGCQTNNNYFHWLIEAMSRIYLVDKVFPNEDVKLIIPRLRPWMTKMLAAIGVNPNRFVQLDIEGFTTFEKLIFPSRGLGSVADFSSHSLEFLENLANKFEGELNSITSKKRFYISRSDTSSRRILNESDIMEVLAKHRVEILYPEKMEFHEQICLFREADLVIGALGAGLTNISFAKPNTAVIELAPEGRTGDANLFANLAHWRNQRYSVILGASNQDCNKPPDRLDFTIDVKALESAIKSTD